MKYLQQNLILWMLCLFSFFGSCSAFAESLDDKDITTKVEQKLGQVNINQASAEELAKVLTGIGINKSLKIVEYRQKFGPFVAIEQLKEVSGIGQSLLDNNVGKIVL